MKRQRLRRLAALFAQRRLTRPSAISLGLPLTATTQVPQNLFGCVVSRRSGYTSPWMGARTTQVQSFNRRAVLRPAGDGTQEKQLLKTQISVKNISFGQAVGSLQVQW